MAIESEKIYECQAKRRRLKTGGGYEFFWKLKTVLEAVSDEDAELRCSDCTGAVKLHRRHIDRCAPTPYGPQAEERFGILSGGGPLPQGYGWATAADVRAPCAVTRFRPRRSDGCEWVGRLRLWRCGAWGSRGLRHARYTSHCTLRQARRPKRIALIRQRLPPTKRRPPLPQ